ncbi:hypothetical protein ACQRIU_004364 [Beauveria bassiana]
MFLHNATGMYWPVHLLPHEVPSARILTFGYDADVATFIGPVGKNTIEDHASNLVNDLARVKRRGAPASGKMIFVAHSLGGLITMKAMSLSESAAVEHLRQIERDTIAIAFFGTPHRGSNLAPFAKLVANFFQASGKRINSDILEVLKRDSQPLAGVERDFVNWVARKGQNFQVSCFFETEEPPGVGMIVKAESAKFGHWPQQGVRANHMDMVKFSSAEVDGFQRIVEELQRWTEELDQKRDFLWLEGKPGSGKSTLTKRIGRNIREERHSSLFGSPREDVENACTFLDKNTIVAVFHYSFRGGCTETSHELMLRSLVYQIWRADPRLFSLLQGRYRQLKGDSRFVVAGKNSMWTYDDLKAALLSLYQIDFSIDIFVVVDGLDESDNEMRDDML